MTKTKESAARTDMARVRALADIETYSADEKAEIVELGAKYGVTVRKTTCASCYSDAVAELYARLLNEVAAEENTACVCRFKNKQPFTIMYNQCAYRFSQATITDEKARKFLAAGVLREEMFEVLPPAEDTAAETGGEKAAE